MNTYLQKILMLIAVLLTSLSAYPYDFEVDGIYYQVLSLSDLSCEVVSGDNKYSGDIIIPTEVNYNNKKFSVISIHESAFESCRALSSVHMPNSITSIGEYVFSDCSALRYVSLSNSLSSISRCAFADCTSLSEITIPDSVSNIEPFAFAGCSSLTEINITNFISIIGKGAFASCSSLVSLTIPDSVISIEESAFAYCISLKFITIPNSLTSIETKLFCDCKTLTNITIPDSVTTICDEAFSGCTSLIDISMGSSITSIGKRAFAKCSSLKEIIIPNSVVTIGEEAFFQCFSLKNIKLSESLETIKKDTFWQCEQLESITIPGCINVISWGSWSNGVLFYHCTNLKEMSFLFGETPLEVSYLFLNDLSEPLPIKHLYIDRELEWNDYSCLNQITKLSLGPNVRGFNGYFYNNNTDLETIQCYSITPPTINEFTNIQYMNIKVIVPYEALEVYQQAEVWKNFWNLEGFDPNVIDAEMISLNIQEAELNIGETVQLEATVLPEDTTDKTIEWKSSNDEIVIVDEFGLVTAISEGSATITAILGSLTATCEVTVYTPIIEAEQVVLTIDKAEINIGETVQLKATVLPEDTTDKTLEWKSSNEEVAIVDESGLVTAISEGYATISVTCGEASAQCEITVIEENGVESILANPNSSISIYSVDGVIIKKDAKVEDLKTLVKGVYIIVSGENRYKVSI